MKRARTKPVSDHRESANQVRGLAFFRRAPFVPPKQRSRLWLGLLRLPCLIVARLVYRCHYPPTYRRHELKKILNYRNERLMIVCNHPLRSDPIILFDFLLKLGPPFAIAAARSNFTRAKGLLGWLYQSAGAYSVRRGTVDRPYLTNTLRLLEAPSGKVAIFPEGSTTDRLDQTLPFPKALFQLPMKAAATSTMESDVFIVPVALVYHIRKPIQKAMISAIDALYDKYLVKSHDPDEDLISRLRNLGGAILERYEEQKGLQRRESLDERVMEAKKLFIREVATKNNVQLKSDTPMDNARELLDHWHSLLDEVQGDEESGSEKIALAHPDSDFLRLWNWLPVEPGYIRDRVDTVRVSDMVRRMQDEWNLTVFRENRSKRERVHRLRIPVDCTVRIGPPIRVRPFLGQADGDQKLAQYVKSEIDAMLHERIW